MEKKILKSHEIRKTIWNCAENGSWSVLVQRPNKDDKRTKTKEETTGHARHAVKNPAQVKKHYKGGDHNTGEKNLHNHGICEKWSIIEGNGLKNHQT